MKFTIADTLHRQHLCATCSYGRVTQHRDGRIETMCGHGCTEGTVRGFVESCTAYSFKYRSAPHDMEQIAWVLERKKGKVIGFKPPEEA